MLGPGGEAATDEAPPPRFDGPEPRCFAYQLRLRSGLREALLEPRLLGAQQPDVGLPRVEPVLRAQVGVSRLPVEERDEQQPAEREQPRRSKTDHSGGFSPGRRLPTFGPRRSRPSPRLRVTSPA